MVLSGILTVFAAIIGSTTALWIATKVYRQQKLVDAENVRTIEKRKALRDFFRSAAKLHTELRAAAHRGRSRENHFNIAEQCLHDLYRDQEALAFSTSGDTLKLCRKYTLALLGLRNHVSSKLFSTEVAEIYSHLDGPGGAIEAVLDAREKALIAGRSELLGQSKEQSAHDLAGILSRMYEPGELSKLRPMFDRDEEI